MKALLSFVAALLEPPRQPAFCTTCAGGFAPLRVVSACSTVYRWRYVKFASPGVPDLYHCNELPTFFSCRSLQSHRGDSSCAARNLRSSKAGGGTAAALAEDSPLGSRRPVEGLAKLCIPISSSVYLSSPPYSPFYPATIFRLRRWSHTRLKCRRVRAAVSARMLHRGWQALVSRHLDPMHQARCRPASRVW